MTQYINKATLEEKIDKLENQDFSVIDDLSGRAAYLRAIEDFYKILDTLEVKEVDLDEAARKWEDKVYLEKGWQNEYGTPHAPFSEIGNAFKAGFELGLKAQKGE